MAFFSGTDESTLLSEGKDMNHFLSLIVCNNGPYVARITRKLKQKIKAEAHIVYTKTTEYDTFENNTIVIGDPETSEADKTEERSEFIVEYFNGIIDKAEVPYSFHELDDRLDEIKRSKSRTKKCWGFNNDIYEWPTYRHEREDVSFKKEKEELLKEEKKTTARKAAKEQQLSIFRDYEKRDEPLDLYKMEEVPLNIVKTLCTQLMFGSILADGNANINLKDFAKRMDKVYFKRFGDIGIEANKLRLKSWIGMFIEVLIQYTVDEDYEMELVDKYGIGKDFDFELDGDVFVQLYADAMIQYMLKLPESEVKDMMITELVSLMPLDYEQETIK